MKKIEVPQPKLTVLKKKESALNIDFTNRVVEEFFKLEGYSENTIRAYKRAFTRFRSWKELSWGSYTRKDLADYREYLDTLNLKSASIHQELSALKKLFAWLTVEEFIERDPALALKLPKITSSIDSTEIPLEVVSEVESNLNSPRDFALYYVLLHGLRRQEIAKLKIKDYRDKAIATREAKWGSDRVVPLLPKRFLL